MYEAELPCPHGTVERQGRRYPPRCGSDSAQLGPTSRRAAVRHSWSCTRYGTGVRLAASQRWDLAAGGRACDTTPRTALGQQCTVRAAAALVCRMGPRPNGRYRTKELPDPDSRRPRRPSHAQLGAATRPAAATCRLAARPDSAIRNAGRALSLRPRPVRRFRAPLLQDEDVSPSPPRRFEGH
jgi:hypothetical protein